MWQRVPRRYVRHVLNFWPPYLGAGIRVKRLSSDWKEVDVEMKLRRWNSNYVGTHFGGSLYSMADPFFMLMLIANLGPEYTVWDKAASIRFRKPGRGTVFAHFHVTDDELAEIRAALEVEEKIDRVFHAEIKDESGTLIAEVEKLVNIRRKKA